MSGAQPFKDRVEVATLDPVHDALAVSPLPRLPTRRAGGRRRPAPGAAPSLGGQVPKPLVACMTWRALQATAIPKNREGAVEALRAFTIA